MSFLTGRKGIFHDGDQRHSIYTEIGCPQGSILSPFLWNVLIDGILRPTDVDKNELIAFADGITLIAWDSNAVLATF